MNGADCQAHDVDVLHLVMTTHIIDLSLFAFAHYQVNGLAMVLHIEPVAYILTLTIDG